MLVHTDRTHTLLGSLGACTLVFNVGFQDILNHGVGSREWGRGKGGMPSSELGDGWPLGAGSGGHDVLNLVQCPFLVGIWVFRIHNQRSDR